MSFVARYSWQAKSLRQVRLRTTRDGRRTTRRGLLDRLCRTHVCVVRVAWNHGYHNVFAFLVVHVFDTKQHLVLIEAELRLLTYREQGWMLFVFRSDGVDQLIGLQNIFGA